MACNIINLNVCSLNDVRVYSREEPCVARAARILMDININTFTSFKYLSYPQCLIFQSSPVSWGAERAAEFK